MTASVSVPSGKALDRQESIQGVAPINIRVLAIILMAALALAACSSTEEGADAADPTAAPAGDSTDASAESTPGAAAAVPADRSEDTPEAAEEPTAVTADPASAPEGVSTIAPVPTETPEPEATTADGEYAGPTGAASLVGFSIDSGIDASKYAGSCEGLAPEDQKATLIKIGNEIFDGSTTHEAELAKLHYAPDARDRRQGGILVSIEFNGDEQNTVHQKKFALDTVMRDAFEAFYGANCSDLQEVNLAARLIVIGAGENGPMMYSLAVVYKTSLKREVADTVDWFQKDSLDFNEVWRTLLLNTRWNRELREDPP